MARSRDTKPDAPGPATKGQAEVAKPTVLGGYGLMPPGQPLAERPHPDTPAEPSAKPGSSAVPSPPGAVDDAPTLVMADEDEDAPTAVQEGATARGKPLAAMADGDAAEIMPVIEVGEWVPEEVLSELGSVPPASSPPEAGGAGELDTAAPVPSERPGPTPAKRCPRCGTHFSGRVAFCPFDGEAVVLAPDHDPSKDPLVGHVISNRYLVEGVLAEGGMGLVYRVRHQRLGNVFAMKVLRRDLAREEHVASRLVHEARATASIGHPNIVGVTDFGEIGDETLPELGDLRLPYFVMEMVPGKSLAELIRNVGTLSAVRTAKIVLQCAHALAAAHDVGIIHRDLKPENIRLTSGKAGEEIAKIVDFGVAKVIGNSRKTEAGMVFGTPHYMSPEQGQGHSVDGRTDVYALGVIMYEALTGRVPFEADSYMGVVTKHLFKRPDPIGLGSDLGEVPIEPIMMRCLEKRAEDRYQSMRDLAADLDQALAGLRSVPPPSMKPGRLKLREREGPPVTAIDRPSDPDIRTFIKGGRTLPIIVLGAAAVACVVAIVYLLGLFGAGSAKRDAAPARVGSSAPTTTLGAPERIWPPPTSRLVAGAPEPPDAAAEDAAASTTGELGPTGGAAPTATRPTATKRRATPPPRTTKTRRVPTGEVVDPWDP